MQIAEPYIVSGRLYYGLVSGVFKDTRFWSFVDPRLPRPLNMSQALTVIGDVANVFGGVICPAKDVLVAISSSLERVSLFA